MSENTFTQILFGYCAVSVKGTAKMLLSRTLLIVALVGVHNYFKAVYCASFVSVVRKVYHKPACVSSEQDYLPFAVGFKQSLHRHTYTALSSRVECELGFHQASMQIRLVVNQRRKFPCVEMLGVYHSDAVRTSDGLTPARLPTKVLFHISFRSSARNVRPAQEHFDTVSCLSGERIGTVCEYFAILKNLRNLERTWDTRVQYRKSGSSWPLGTG